MRYIQLSIYLITYWCYGNTQSYVPSYVSCGLTACDVLSTMRQEMEDKRYDRQLWEFKEKLELVTNLEYKFAEISVEFDKMSYEFLEFKQEFRKFVENQNNKPEASTLLHSRDNPDQSDTTESNHENKLLEIEEKLERSLDTIESVKSLKSEIELLKKEIQRDKTKNELMIEENTQQVKELHKENVKRINQVQKLEILINDTYSVCKESSDDVEKKIKQLQDVKISFKNQLDDHMNVSSAVSTGLEQQIEHLLNQTTAEIADFKMTMLANSNDSAEEFDNKISEVSGQMAVLQEEFLLVQQIFNTTSSELSNEVDSSVSEVTDQIVLLQEEVLLLQQNVSASNSELLNAIEDKADKEVVVDVARIENSSQKIRVALDENENKLTKLQREVGVHFNQTSKLQSELEQLRKETDDSTLNKKEIQNDFKVLTKNTKQLELAYKEIKEKLEKTHEMISDLMKNTNNVQKDEGNKDNTFPQPSYITLSDVRASCIHYNYNSDVIASLDGRPITTTVQTVPHGKSVEFRCRDPGAFKFHLSTSRQCIDGNWTNSQPICGPLVSLDEIEANTVDRDAAPAIIIEPRPDSDSTGILPNGTYLIRPGTNVNLACLFVYSLNKIELSVRHSSSHQQALINGKWNDDKTRYEMTITNAKGTDSGAYTCTNKLGDSHTVNLLVERVSCPALPPGNKLGSVGKMHRNMNSELQLQCIELNHKLVWPTNSTDDTDDSASSGNNNNNKIRCLPSGQWSSEWPECVPKTKVP